MDLLSVVLALVVFAAVGRDRPVGARMTTLGALLIVAVVGVYLLVALRPEL